MVEAASPRPACAGAPHVFQGGHFQRASNYRWGRRWAHWLAAYDVWVRCSSHTPCCRNDRGSLSPECGTGARYLEMVDALPKIVMAQRCCWMPHVPSAGGPRACAPPADCASASSCGNSRQTHLLHPGEMLSQGLLDPTLPLRFLSQLVEVLHELIPHRMGPTRL